MTRAAAYALIRRIYGTADAAATLNRLQDAGLVADEAIEPRDVATGDLIEAAKKLDKQRETQ
jgi:hypothetical protein